MIREFGGSSLVQSIETGPVPWAIWVAGEPGGYQQHSNQFPANWLAAPPDWLPNSQDVPETPPESENPWFIRPLPSKRMALGIQVPGGAACHWIILAPSLRQFLDTGSFAPAWVESTLEIIQKNQASLPPDGLCLQIRTPATTAKDLGILLGSQDLAILLGGAQAMVDQARAVVISDGPRSLPFETVLPFVPHSRRAELSLSNWWLSRRLKWDIRVCPENAVEPDSTLWNWENIGDYPVGKYEHALHEAISLGNDAVVSGLLGRASRNAMLRLGLALLVILMAAQFLGALFGWKPKPIQPPVPQQIQQKEGQAK